MTTQTDLIRALEMDALPVEEQESLLSELDDIAFEQTLIRILENLDDSKAEELEHMLERDPSDEEVGAFFKTHVKNLDKLLSETMDDLKSDLLAKKEN